MRYTPVEILKDEAQALFQFEQEMTNQIFDENILSTIDQELVDKKSLYRAVEVIQESILKPKELRKLFEEISTQEDEKVLTNLDQFTDKFGNYIDALSPIFSILKNIYSVNISAKSEVGASSDNKEVSILKEEILAIDKDISVLKTVRDSDLSNIGSNDYYYKIGEIKINESIVESIREEDNVRDIFEEFIENNIEDTFSYLNDEMENIDNMIREVRGIVKIEDLENLSLERIGDNNIGLDLIYKLESISSATDEVFLRVATMCHTLNQMMHISLNSNINIYLEMNVKLFELLRDNFENSGIGEFKGSASFIDIIENNLQALFDKLDNQKWGRILVNITFYQELRELTDSKDEKQAEIKELQKVTTNTPSKPQKIERVENSDLQDLSMSLERMKERNKSLKQCIEKYI